MIDIYESAQYLQGVPHDKYTALRRQQPVSFQPERDGPGYWAVMRHADVVTVSKNPGVFSSAAAGINIPDPTEDDLEIAQMIMINMDPPQHAKYRRLVSRGFTPRMTQRLEGTIAAAVDRILDQISGHGTVDFVGAIAAQLPLHLIAELIGWPEADRTLMFDWSNRVARIDFDPDDAREAAMEFWNYCAELIEGLEEAPEDTNADDLIHTLMTAQIDGEGLELMEIVNFLLLLAIGGNETTRNCISGGFLALHQTPGQWDALKANPAGLMETAVEEMLRWTSPIIAFRRTALEDTQIGDQAIAAGDKVVLYYASANRDEEVFADPQRFDIARTPNPHLSFGVGQHYCLGTTLARLEIRLLFERLVQRFPDMVPVGPVQRARSGGERSSPGSTMNWVNPLT